MEQNDQWYYLKNAEPAGPVSYQAMIELRQLGTLVETDQVWNPSLDLWISLGHCPEFSSERIKNLFYEKKLPNTFATRKNRRLETRTQILIHDHRKLCQGQTTTLSEHGALIDVFDSGLVVGETLIIHFKKTDVIEKSFNCQAQLLEKKISKKKKLKSEATQYVVRFDPAALEKIKHILLKTQGVHA